MKIVEMGACWAMESGVILQGFQHSVKLLRRQGQNNKAVK
jgi:hypothetical protein